MTLSIVIAFYTFSSNQRVYNVFEPNPQPKSGNGGSNPGPVVEYCVVYYLPRDRFVRAPCDHEYPAVCQCKYIYTI